MVALSLGSAGHALLMKRDPRSALGWIVISITMPVAGPLLYWSMGVNRIRRKAMEWRQSGRRLGIGNFKAKRVAESAAILPEEADHLQELRAIADRVVVAPLVSGNAVTPLVNGEGAYPAMLEAIAAARQSIHLSTYIFDADTTGLRFIEALKEAAEKGVEVRVIIDGLGEKYSLPRARSLFKGSRVKVGRFLPLRQGFYLNLRNHRKLLVVDGRIGFTGGMNIGDRHLVATSTRRGPVRDMHFRVDGPVVGELQRVFLEDWFFVAGELLDDRRFFPAIPPAGQALSRGIADGPDKVVTKQHWIVMGALSAARKRVWIMTPYFIPDRAMISALATTAMRGVAVTLILPARNNLPYVHWATRAYLWELLQHGIRIVYQPPPFVHSKLMLVDDAWSLIGSSNLDPRSLRLNFEFNLEVYDAALNSRLSEYCDAAIRDGREVTLAEVDARSLPEKLRDGAAKLFSPYL
ncbi:MAG: cardiolipin synthase [Geobacter sp.]|nr:cardiolipin synthase [Geobacter sp.]